MKEIRLAHDLTGKRVRAADGKDIGKIIGVRLDSKTFSLDGIEIDRGFFGNDTFVGQKYIDSLSMDGAVLNMSPVSDYKGMDVFDSTGKKVGKIKEIRTSKDSNNISAIVVETGILKNDVIFSKSDIREVGESVMLNVAFDKDAVKVGGIAQ